ncbi:LTA synthase family protein [Neptunomonas qingdaonensis]|uniref:Phosphoglycerol transferase MdoB n=1 Tax=Neptunomonas qingdaonensis TaxID=1045558 RepID=A0A1I2Q0E3_9GAMM|nr:LTA synthase family protein [Neptunomonas qingdaonensis]SFG19101.1 Phosphoglycerol transferase MdoB [Neptunomonas qingdaonensis]
MPVENLVAELLWPLLLFPILTGLIVTFAMEFLLQPTVVCFWRRPFNTFCLHLGSFLLLYCAALLLCWRPWFALSIVLSFQLLLVLVNNAKYHSMREPFLIYDFEYFTDAIKHPRLYLPFFGIYKAILAAIGFVAVIVLAMIIEPSLLNSAGAFHWLTMVTGLMIIASALLWIGVRLNRTPMTLQPEDDFVKVGLVSFLWLYGIEHIRHQPIHRSVNWEDNFKSEAEPHRLANVVVVQSESFFDARKDYDLLNADVLSQYDDICSESAQFGRLSVPAWGANTIRTESAFLTGLEASHFGVHQFSPYRYFMKNEQYTLAHLLKEKGYRTVCIHPYQASFYMRDMLYPRLGFDHFIDINAFSDSQKQGQYIGDIAVAEKVGELLGESQQPLFIFVITMENHGPLHLEKPDSVDQQLFYKDKKQPEGCDDLTVYTRHLSNADQMASMLRQQLQADLREGVLCWYGDHVPIMADVYRRLGEPSGLTDYFVWTTTSENQQKPLAENIAIKVSGLVPLVTQQLSRLASL